MTADRSTHPAATAARTEILAALKADHRRVGKALRDFRKLDADEDPARCGAIVRQALDALSVHFAVADELLYAAARAAGIDQALIDRAEVEHEVVRGFVEQLRDMSPIEDKFAARFTVLCEFVLHHAKAEEGEMFPQLERAPLDWEALAAEMAGLRAALTGDDVLGSPLPRRASDCAAPA